ncbi:hypothetical protein [Agromyces italicus]|uniref:hypothetical protein n=1 Tax=Agromyces italicus TaxID=279572 RepID=UPI0012F75A5A|nr:hypothetical protein [Agromyces italicus]
MFVDACTYTTYPVPHDSVPEIDVVAAVALGMPAVTDSSPATTNVEPIFQPIPVRLPLPASMSALKQR